MIKSYSDYMNEITPDELYDSLIEYGLFSSKLPPIFDGNSFLNYCKKPGRPEFPQKWYSYASFSSIKNTNIPRAFGIPTPMAHERICACLRQNWNDLQLHFLETTKAQIYKVSRTHIRKMKNTNALFQMNYEKWQIDGTPEPDISFGKKYLVKADISTCFPSIYSHAIPWAIVTKNVAKQNANDDTKWYNQIDIEARNSTNGETHGLLIGPHTSNILSEIVLCAIDASLIQNWDYIRHIDDFSCYVNSKEDADRFLIELDDRLRDYSLSLNHKKTEIIELPIGAVENWIHQIQNREVYFEKFKPYVNYREAQAFIDFCLELMSKNKDNASILFYGIKVLSSHNLSANAIDYVTKTITSLSLLFPYIVPLLDQFVYSHFKPDETSISKYINQIYIHYLDKNYFEAVSYAFYMATKYDIEIEFFDVNQIIQKNDCILSLCCLIYCRHFKLRKSLASLKKYAKALIEKGDLEEQWVFVYECLNVGQFEGAWVELKKGKVSFLKTEYR